MMISVVVLVLGYVIYGRWLVKIWGIDPEAKTPAYELRDGVDYEPADTNVVFGHQFASIAGAGPINGPIQAAVFGWVPVLMWILIGGVFFGAVQDFAAMYAIGLPHNVIFTLINLAVSAFALTSLDSVARVGRLSFQEIFLNASIEDDNMESWRKILTNKYVATIITLLLAYFLAKVGSKDIWPLFGSANQLLSALALIACVVYMKKSNRKGWMLWIPMAFMLIVTFTALIQKIFGLINDPTPGNLMQAFFAVALFILGVIIAVLGLKELLAKKTTGASETV